MHWIFLYHVEIRTLPLISLMFLHFHISWHTFHYFKLILNEDKKVFILFHGQMVTLSNIFASFASFDCIENLSSFVVKICWYLITHEKGMHWIFFFEVMRLVLEKCEGRHKKRFSFTWCKYCNFFPTFFIWVWKKK